MDYPLDIALQGLANYNSMEKDAFSLNPRVTEGLVGGSLGAAAGYYASNQQHKKRNAALGAVGGAGAAIGLNYGAYGVAKGVNKATQGAYDTMGSEAAGFADKAEAGLSNANMGDEAVAEATARSRGIARSFLKINKMRKEMGTTTNVRDELARDAMHNVRNMYNNVSSFNPEEATPEGGRIAEDIASRTKIKNYRNKYIGNTVGTAQNSTAFGGLRSMGKSVKNMGSAARLGVDMNNATEDMQMRMDVNDRFRFDKVYNGVANEDEIAAARKTKEFADRYRAATHEGTKRFYSDQKAKANNKGWSYDSGYKERYYGDAGSSGGYSSGGSRYKGFNGANVDTHAQTLGLDLKQFKTKKDFNKHLKTVYKNNHPDLATNDADRAARAKNMPNINAAIDAIKGSSWFDKLAFVRQFRR